MKAKLLKPPKINTMPLEMSALLIVKREVVVKADAPTWSWNMSLATVLMLDSTPGMFRALRFAIKLFMSVGSALKAAIVCAVEGTSRLSSDSRQGLKLGRSDLILLRDRNRLPIIAASSKVKASVTYRCENPGEMSEGCLLHFPYKI